MASSGHPQYGTQQTAPPGSLPPAYYAAAAAAAAQMQPQMMYSYEDMQLLQQRVPMVSSPTQLQQMTTPGGVYVSGNPNVHPYMAYQYAPSMVPGVPVQYGGQPLYQYPANVPMAGHSAQPQYPVQPKMIYANPTHPYYESPLSQDFKMGSNAHTTHVQSKLVAPRVAVNSAHDISASVKSQLGKPSSHAYNSAAGLPPSPYSSMSIIPSLPGPGAAHPSALLQHQMKPKY